MDKYDYTIKICSRFNKCISVFIKTAEMKSPNNPEISQVKRIITIGKSIDETIVLKECVDNIWKYRKYVQNRDFSFLDNKNIIKDTPNEHVDLIVNLTQFIKGSIGDLSKEELDRLWELADEMVVCVAEYKALTEHGIEFYLQFINQS